MGSLASLSALTLPSVLLLDDCLLLQVGGVQLHVCPAQLQRHLPGGPQLQLELLHLLPSHCVLRLRGRQTLSLGPHLLAEELFEATRLQLARLLCFGCSLRLGDALLKSLGAATVLILFLSVLSVALCPPLGVLLLSDVKVPVFLASLRACGDELSHSDGVFGVFSHNYPLGVVSQGASD